MKIMAAVARPRLLAHQLHPAKFGVLLRRRAQPRTRFTSLLSDLLTQVRSATGRTRLACPQLKTWRGL